LWGSFSEFGAPYITLEFNNDLMMIQELKAAAADHRIGIRELTRDYPLDHGAAVPLYYLREAGWQGPTVVAGFTEQSNHEHLAFGRLIAQSAFSLNRRVAVIASGDLSHRLIKGGPYEYEPTAHLFDRQIVDAVSSGNSKGILNIDTELRLRAGECGYRSIVIALGAVDQNIADHEVLSYEGPFGVGYLVAVLLEKATEAHDVIKQLTEKQGDSRN
jgi:AmmeMemoRadiSam system protein B